MRFIAVAPSSSRLLCTSALLACVLAVPVAALALQDNPRATTGPGDNVDPDTVSDTASMPGDPDYNDNGLLPAAFHDVQHFEWLGQSVDEEPAAVVDDNTAGHTLDDDGILGLEWEGNHVHVRVRVHTAYSNHPVAYPAGSREYVDAWIDWNKNAVYEHPSEYVGGIGLTPPFGGFIGPDSAATTITGIAMDGPGSDYHVRLRVDWHDTGNVHTPSPGGEADGNTSLPDSLLPLASYGEVEDFRAADPWYTRCLGKGGSNGIAPQLTGTGSGIPGSAHELDLQWAKPNAPALLIIGFTRLEVPLKGGTLEPSPDIIAPLTTNASGEIKLPFTLDPAIPVLLKVYMQYWITDTGVSYSLASSNGLRILVK